MCDGVRKRDVSDRDVSRSRDVVGDAGLRRVGPRAMRIAPTCDTLTLTRITLTVMLFMLMARDVSGRRELSGVG